VLRSISRFLFLGALCFATVQLWRVVVGAQEPLEPIHISELRIEGLRDNFVAAWSAAPSDRELRMLIEREIDDDVLHREAFRLGLAGADPVVRQRLVQNMRFLGRAEDASSGDDASLYLEALELGMAQRDLVVRRRLIQQMTVLLGSAIPEPAEDEVRAYANLHAEGFSTSHKAKLSYVFVTANDEAESRAADAVEVLAALIRASNTAAEDQLELPYSVRFEVFTEALLIRRFGAPLAAELTNLERGRWMGPYSRDGGSYLVRLDELISGAIAPFELVKDRASFSLLQERRDTAVAQATRKLRNRYEIRVDGDTVGERRRS
jgi:hypothetical protein